MPGIDGWEVVRRIRAQGFEHLPIIIVSANAFENQHLHDDPSKNSDFLVKPVIIPQLLELLQKNLSLDWIFTDDGKSPPRAEPISIFRMEERDINELVALGNIGYVRGIELKLASLQQAAPESRPLLSKLGDYVRTFEFELYLKTLEALRQRDK
jgi:CheY-like chemotaxis protein